MKVKTNQINLMTSDDVRVKWPKSLMFLFFFEGERRHIDR